MSRSKGPAIGLIAAVILAGAGFAAYRHYATLGRSAMMCSLMVDYEVLPPDDIPFIEWLRARPGLVSETVTRDGSKLSIRFDLGDPHDPDPLGDVVRQLDALGYQARVGYSGRFGRRIPYDYQTLRIDYAALPPDDAPLTAWLKENPGLVRSAVDRQGTTLSVEFAMTDPPAPTMLRDILKKCETLGYEQRKGYVSGFGPYR